MKKRNYVRIISYLLAAVLVSLGFTSSFYTQKKYLQNRIEDEYFNSINEMSAKISEINFDLKKQLYCNSSSMKANYCTKICENASGAKECLARLPIAQENAENIYKYLATVSDYSKSMLISQSSAKTNTGLKKLIDFSDNLNADFNILQSKIENSTVFDGDIENMLNSTAKKTSFSGNIKDLSQVTKSFPTLIYDGPFSEHTLRAKPQYLREKTRISQSEAKRVAQSVLGENDIDYTGEETSAIKSYTFEGKNGGVCAITKNGGYCLYLNKTSGAVNKKLSVKVALNNAKSYLKTLYNLDFKESYYEKFDNIITINFAVYEKGVICYSD